MPDDTDTTDAQSESTDGEQSEQREETNDGEGFRAITSQEELDRVMKRRLNQERAKFADYDQVKSKAQKYDELEEAQKSELEKATSARERAEKEAADARRELQQERTRSAVLSEAAKQGAVDTDAVFRLLDPADLEHDDSGKPTNVAAVVEALLAERTYLVNNGGDTSPRKRADQGARETAKEGQLARSALDNMSPQEVRDAVRSGKLDGVLAGSSGD